MYLLLILLLSLSCNQQSTGVGERLGQDVPISTGSEDQISKQTPLAPLQSNSVIEQNSSNVAQNNENTVILQLVNKFRNEHNLPSLTLSKTMVNGCIKHAQRMGDSVGLEHDRELRDGGYIRENIAAGQLSPTEVFQNWIDSPSHKENILSSDITTMGIGFYVANTRTFSSFTNDVYWCQRFHTL